MTRRLYVQACLLALALEVLCHPTNLYLTAIAPWRGAVGTVVFTLLAGSIALPLERAHRIVETAMRFVPALLVTVALVEARDWSVPASIWWAVVAAIGFLFGALAFSPSLRLTIGASIAAGLLLRALQISANAGLGKHGDMLPLVDAALARLQHGESPYFGYMLPSGYVPLTYLPVTWLAYLPFRAVGLDLRWAHALAHVATLGAVLVSLGKGGDEKHTQARVRLASWPLLSATFIAWDLGATAPIFWAVLAWTLGSVLRDTRRAPVWLGVCLATSPLALPFAVLIATAWWRKGGLPLAARRLGLSAATAFAIGAPFVLWSPRAFFDGTVGWFNSQFPPQWWRAVQHWQPVPGFATWFWRGGAAWALKPLQAAVIAGCAAYVWRGRAPAVRLQLVLGSGFVAFMLLNPVLWTYFYTPAFVAALVASACAGVDAEAS